MPANGTDYYRWRKGQQTLPGRKLPVIIASPQVAAGEIWDAHSVHALSEELASSLPVDRHRIYLTGLSMRGEREKTP